MKRLALVVAVPAIKIIKGQLNTMSASISQHDNGTDLETFLIVIKLKVSVSCRNYIIF